MAMNTIYTVLKIFPDDMACLFMCEICMSNQNSACVQFQAIERNKIQVCL